MQVSLALCPTSQKNSYFHDISEAAVVILRKQEEKDEENRGHNVMLPVFSVLAIFSETFMFD